MKLVRDKIPELMEASGKKPLTHVAGERDFEEFLFKKMDEEVAEIKRDKNPEELADLLEVMHALALQIGVSIDDVERIRQEKRKKNSGFSKRIILENPK